MGTSNLTLETAGNLNLVEVTSPALLTKVQFLRVTAWRTFLDIPDSLHQWVDHEDTTARHWAFVTCDGNPVASARLSVHPDLHDLPDAEVLKNVLTTLPAPIGSLNRLVVHPQFRGRNLAAPLDRVRVQAAKESGCLSVIVTVDVPKRAATLESHGFRLAGIGTPYKAGILTGVSNHVYVMMF